ncbi:hypothetical protein PLIIFM63780_001079 [Purpureocillium lilacinum]|uniref:Uncharacterized protein n=1 Tax=Purpureocillium lilacinum TaxID=33203 RepID=A0A179H372_PURLI|nr:hypothetical protein Purlil1_4300 [Purpureocillium lilacinum]OAQ84462.1 hypothetical protein VFPBJ_03230 [Purpureocillium lilacinum]GJN68735.1 hypothetical protein PLICBS_002779 [Purpureocillium lilacinum]GJN77587.1 hypothetical protein PLIIFM63780_001079 [Purpureocillium lilacinum]
MSDQNTCSGKTCCGHPACEVLKSRNWCGRWVFFRLTSPRPVMPSEALAELRQRLGQEDLRFYSSLDDGGTLYEGVVRLPDGASSAEDVLPPPKGSKFDGERSRVWRLSCCWDALDWDVPVWTHALKAGEGMGFGDRGLMTELDNMVHFARRDTGV